MPPGVSFFKLKKLAPANPVPLVPTGYCFLHRQFKPQEANTPEDVRAFANLSLEGLSPFPPEQLAWGWLDAPRQNFLWIVAAYKERLAREAVAIDSKSFYVLPAFTAACAVGFPHARKVFLWEEDTLTALAFTENGLWPYEIITEPLSQPTIQCAFAKRASLMQDQRLGGEGEFIPGVYTEPVASASPSGSISFELKFFDKEQSAEQLVSTYWPRKYANVLWGADLRDQALLQTERKQRTRANILWRACLGACAAAIALLAWQISLSFAERALDKKAGLIKTQEPLVQAIQQNRELLSKIEQSAESELQPYLMLGKLNQLRLSNEITKSLYFVNAQTEGLTGLIVQGKASSIPQVNAYVDALKKSGWFNNVELTNIQSRYTAADFTLKLDFKPLPPPNFNTISGGSHS